VLCSFLTKFNIEDQFSNSRYWCVKQETGVTCPSRADPPAHSYQTIASHLCRHTSASIPWLEAATQHIYRAGYLISGGTVHITTRFLRAQFEIVATCFFVPSHTSYHTDPQELGILYTMNPLQKNKVDVNVSSVHCYQDCGNIHADYSVPVTRGATSLSHVRKAS